MSGDQQLIELQYAEPAGIDSSQREMLQFGCDELCYRGLTVALGTVLKLRLKHFIDEGGVGVEEAVRGGPQDPS